ncbi:hypothetical protein L6386_02650, partial [bacterium]|nr:hypothetical protein [bacterium]
RDPFGTDRHRSQIIENIRTSEYQNENSEGQNISASERQNENSEIRLQIQSGLLIPDPLHLIFW